MIHIACGSNLGDRMGFLRRAVALLRARHMPDLSCSPVIETEALLPPGAGAEWNRPYLNMIVSGTSALAPEALLAALKDIERELGRPAEGPRWAPRAIDLDILLWDDRAVKTPRLTIPHPELGNRPFLLHLMAMTAPLEKLGGKTFAALAAGISGCFTKSLVLSPQLVGVVNVTPDSFSDGGLYADAGKAVAQAQELAADGAAVVEIGAQSTRPGAAMLDAGQEWARLEPVLDALGDDIPLSLDSFRPEVILKALEHPAVRWINDVTGKLDAATLRQVARAGRKIVSMHALSIPPDKNARLPDDADPAAAVGAWAARQTEHLAACGFRREDIILDPGIGFGKSAYQSMILLRQAAALKETGSAVLVGHSRKSFMAAFSAEEARARDLETIAISDGLHRAGVDYLRVHNVRDHQRFFVARQAVNPEGDQKRAATPAKAGVWQARPRVS